MNRQGQKEFLPRAEHGICQRLVIGTQGEELFYLHAKIQGLLVTSLTKRWY